MYAHNFRATASNWRIIFLVCLLVLGQENYKKIESKIFFSDSKFKN